MIQVYFVFAPSSNTMKIGSTKRILSHRLGLLEHQWDEHLELVASIPSSCPDAECIIQWHFRESIIDMERSHEWFSISVEQVFAFICEWLKDGGAYIAGQYYIHNIQRGYYRPVKRFKDNCSVQGCLSIQMSRGLCRRHFMRFAKRVSRKLATWDNLKINELLSQRENRGDNL